MIIVTSNNAENFPPCGQVVEKNSTHPNKYVKSTVTHLFAQKNHQQTGSYCESHHDIAGFHSDFVSGSIKRLKPAVEAGAQSCQCAVLLIASDIVEHSTLLKVTVILQNH